MFERFTDRARRAVVLAQEECRRRGHREIDAGHVVLGALTASEGARLDASDIEVVRRGAESTFADRAVDHGHAEHIPFTPAAKAALERSLQLSLQSGRSHIHSRDVLLAALEQPSLARALTAAGADLDRLRSTMTAGHATAPEDTEDTEDTEEAAHPPSASLMTEGDSQVIIDLLQQIMQRLDTIVERLERDE